MIFNLDYYKYHLIEIFKIWNGGLAIYGGIIGAVISLFVFCKVKKVTFINLCDYLVPFLALRSVNWQMGKFYKSRSVWKQNRKLFENANI